ncbi:MAG: hypothetical protein IT537_03535 [Hyphomicrobiales bacterium]|nr:hypothetical protein [Hyphomicrobiales bacterium]
MAIDRTIMVAGPALSVRSVGELVALAKGNPGRLNYGNSIGIGAELQGRPVESYRFVPPSPPQIGRSVMAITFLAGPTARKGAQMR